VVLAVSAGCSSDPVELTVDLRTDFRPLEDFDAVETELSSAPFEGVTAGSDAMLMAVRVSDDYFQGSRVAEIDGLQAGRTFVRVRLKRHAVVIAQRVVDLQIDQSFALTVVITRNCATVTCPGAGDPEGFSACLDGRCIDPRCTPATPELCGDSFCSDDSDCVAGPGCTASSCVRGACLCEAPMGGVDGGPPPDGGVPDSGSLECTPGATEMDTVPCGDCGEGQQTRMRTCGEIGWGPFADVGSCDTGATCAPGQTETDMRACGNCNSGVESRTRSCDAATCTWGAWSGFGACTGASGCSPGATTGCANGDSCGHRVCRSDCTYGGCQPIRECLRIRPGTSGPEGNNWRCCGSSRWQFCLPSCYWSTDCASCSGCGC
jgi:hypothetical protein